MRIGSLFSGGGALDLAALELFPSSSVAWHCEVDPAASEVLAFHWPAAPNLGDVTQIDWVAVEPVDVLAGGFPCTDVSLAGRRAGLREGTRSGLWAHMATAIDVLRPRYVLVENVRGLLSAAAVRAVESGDDDLGDRADRPVLRALGAVCGDLASVGYDTQWTCVRASDVGACHRRERVFILAHPADADCEGSQGPQSASGFDVSAGGGHAVGRVDALLPTPSVADAVGGHVSRSGDRVDELLLGGIARAVVEGSLLPTPRATDGSKGGPNQRGSSGDLMLPSAVSMLPTPTARLGDGSSRGASHPDRRKELCVKRAGELDEIAVHVVPTEWGSYEAAIRRQEALSRPAPPPTEPNSKGNPRLSPAFVEWMMFWPQGWVTDPEVGLSRNDQLRICGNGVVPQQAVAAFRYLLKVSEVAA